MSGGFSDPDYRRDKRILFLEERLAELTKRVIIVERKQVSDNPINPTVGRIVLFRSTNPGYLGNGASVVPAIVTRVWSNTVVNLTVFCDNAAPLTIASVKYCDGEDGQGRTSWWHWMPYQKQVASGAIAPTQHDTTTTQA